MDHESKQHTILVVDDDPMIRDVLRTLLEQLGHLVVTAGGGREGIERLGIELPELLLLDLHMPDLDGLQTLERIRQRWPTLPVVLVSGTVADQLLQRARQLGIAAILAKPFTREDLVAVVEEALER